MSRRIFTALVVTLFLGACGSMPDVGSSDDQALLRSRSQAILTEFQSVDATLEPLIKSSHAYAIFPRVVSVAVGFGGAHGDGEVYEGGRFIGYADVSQGSVGAQLGGQKYGELILFRTDVALVEFKQGTAELDARATAVAAANGAGRAADYSRGVLVFTLPESGLMAQASLGVQKFRFRPANP